MNLRKNIAHAIILKLEGLFTSIANKPKSFDKTFVKYKAEFKIFTDILRTGI